LASWAENIWGVSAHKKIMRQVQTKYKQNTHTALVDAHILLELVIAAARKRLGETPESVMAIT
tara:strand:+ start:964 stop:1152 length:189 start_codon:yes stop_codon:yes gene_type:complete